MPSNVSITGDDALTLDMVGQMTYCPRRFHLMYVEGRWADNQYTVEGRHVHRRVDAVDHVLESPDAKDVESEKKQAGDEPPKISRSVSLASERLGLTAKLDLVATDGDEAAPVETKRSRVPNTPERTYEPERVQLMAQGLLLREHGYRCDHGVVFYAGSRSRVTVPFTPELEARTLSLIDVSNDKRRTSIFEALQDHGDHTQFSVFLCQLDLAELAQLRASLQQHVHEQQDQILIVDLGQAHHDLDQSIESLGKPFVATPRAHIV